MKGKDENEAEIEENEAYYKGLVNKKTLKKQGFGMLAIDHCLYEGFFKNGKRFGKGRMILLNGDVLEGDFVDGKLEGRVKYEFQDGSTYEGEWKDDAKHGEGKEVKLNGDIYEGTYKTGLKHGYCKVEFVDGSVF